MLCPTFLNYGPLGRSPLYYERVFGTIHTGAGDSQPSGP